MKKVIHNQMNNYSPIKISPRKSETMVDAEIEINKNLYEKSYGPNIDRNKMYSEHIY
jgi:hypothetical protein